jgi:hypothetical protein
MIVVNGCPKAGTHALLKAVELLGQNSWQRDVDHIPFGEPLPEGITKHCFIKRDPRDMLVSWLRHEAKPLTDGMAMSSFMGGWYGMVSRFSPWLRDPNTKVFVFEYLIASDKAMLDLADYLEVPYLETAFPNLLGMTKTWTGGTNPMTPNFSDYRQIWTPALEAFWIKFGGDALLKYWGY